MPDVFLGLWLFFSISAPVTPSLSSFHLHVISRLAFSGCCQPEELFFGRKLSVWVVRGASRLLKQACVSQPSHLNIKAVHLSFHLWK